MSHKIDFTPYQLNKKCGDCGKFMTNNCPKENPRSQQLITAKPTASYPACAAFVDKDVAFDIKAEELVVEPDKIQVMAERVTVGYSGRQIQISVGVRNADTIVPLNVIQAETMIRQLQDAIRIVKKNIKKARP